MSVYKTVVLFLLFFKSSTLCFGLEVKDVEGMYVLNPVATKKLYGRIHDKNNELVKAKWIDDYFDKNFGSDSYQITIRNGHIRVGISPDGFYQINKSSSDDGLLILEVVNSKGKPGRFNIIKEDQGLRLLDPDGKIVVVDNIKNEFEIIP